MKASAAIRAGPSSASSEAVAASTVRIDAVEVRSSAHEANPASRAIRRRSSNSSRIGSPLVAADRSPSSHQYRSRMSRRLTPVSTSSRVANSTGSRSVPGAAPGSSVSSSWAGRPSSSSAVSSMTGVSAPKRSEISTARLDARSCAAFNSSRAASSRCAPLIRPLARQRSRWRCSVGDRAEASTASSATNRSRRANTLACHASKRAWASPADLTDGEVRVDGPQRRRSTVAGRRVPRRLHEVAECGVDVARRSTGDRAVDVSISQGGAVIEGRLQVLGSQPGVRVHDQPSPDLGHPPEGCCSARRIRSIDPRLHQVCAATRARGRSAALGQRGEPGVAVEGARRGTLAARRRGRRRPAGSRPGRVSRMPSPIDRPGSWCWSVRTRATGSTASTRSSRRSPRTGRVTRPPSRPRTPRTPGAVPDGISSARSASGSQTQVPARSSAVVSTSCGQPPEVGGARLRRRVAAVGHRHPAVGDLPAGEALLERLAHVDLELGEEHLRRLEQVERHEPGLDVGTELDPGAGRRGLDPERQRRLERVRAQRRAAAGDVRVGLGADDLLGLADPARDARCTRRSSRGSRRRCRSRARASPG